MGIDCVWGESVMSFALVDTVRLDICCLNAIPLML